MVDLRFNHLFIDAIRQDLRKLGLQESTTTTYYTHGCWWNASSSKSNYTFTDQRGKILVQAPSSPVLNTKDEDSIVRVILGCTTAKYSIHSIDVLNDFERSMDDVKYIISKWIIKHKSLYRKNPAFKRQLEYAKKIVHDYPTQYLHNLSCRLQSRNYPPNSQEY
jgi:hypothetical protein